MSLDKSRVPWGLGDVSRALVLPVLIYGVTLLARRSGGDTISPTPDGGGVSYTTGLLVIVFQLALLGPVWWWGLRKYGVGLAALGFRGFAWPSGCALTITMLILGYMFTGAWGFFLARYGLRAQPNPLPLFGEGTSGLLVALLAGGIVAPFTEEVFFRGFVFPPLRDRFGSGWGIAFSSLMFAIAHLQPLALPALFALGALLTLLYHRTGSLWPGIIMHATVNTLALLILYFINPS